MRKNIKINYIYLMTENKKIKINWIKQQKKILIGWWHHDTETSYYVYDLM